MAAESSALKPPCRRFPSVFPQTHLACCPVPCSGEFVHQWSFQVLQQGLECRDCSCRAQRVTEGLCCSQGWSAGIAPAGSRGSQRVCAAARVRVQELLLQGTEGHIRVCAAARVGVQGLLLQGTEGHIRVCAAARVGVQGLLLQGTEGHRGSHQGLCCSQGWSAGIAPAGSRGSHQGLCCSQGWSARIAPAGHRGSHQGLCCSQGWSAGIAPAGSRGSHQGLCCSQGWSAGIAPAGHRGSQRVSEGHIRVCAAATWDIPGVPLGGAVAGLRAAVRHLQQQHSTVQHSHLPHKGDFWGGQEQGEVSGAVLMVQLGRVATTEIRVMCKRQLGKEKINKKFFCFFG
ncbi:uncharacterized protein LOC130260420 isoform X4 [Oenanthe melanoleuca]|uniref:uncharacterized protein LOC130260420 isoform X4 n=1 Tax=Oenanthe melanoleuca TaxID=2939378 RepID=UPI0024C14C5C|nr:uncharacterized protein LOC130260420 isoform X4 [Oenanthe melanoleuca]